MNRSDCIFCRIIAGQIPAAKVFENEHVLAFLDVGPISDGHTLVIPKEHFATVDEASPEVLAAVWQVMPKIAEAVSKAVNCRDYNVLCNNGRAAGQIVKHVHFHIIPRKSGDKLLGSWPSYKYKEGQIEDFSGRIKEILIA